MERKKTKFKLFLLLIYIYKTKTKQKKKLYYVLHPSVVSGVFSHTTVYQLFEMLFSSIILQIKYYSFHLKPIMVMSTLCVYFLRVQCVCRWNVTLSYHVLL